ncbi:hypothetical protein PGT21_010397 [Puccinia graminis f. sp. tritici]|uniref:Uncharacterized protein n=1 Tax=Puccinia graminis f. sp. tritici TaxID=56615 RepID=A0A5B0PTY7_PUCGR|nr:hypothetical protein PGT21_010397 [Puccinia graminis f. sp. tritici]
MSCKPAGLQSSSPHRHCPSAFFSPSIGFSVPQARRAGSLALVGQVVDRGKGPAVKPESSAAIGQTRSWVFARAFSWSSPRFVFLPTSSSITEMARASGSADIEAGPRASNPYPLRSRMSLPQPSSPLERDRTLGSPIRLDSRASSRPPLLNASPIAPPLSVQSLSAGDPIEIDSQGSPHPLADPHLITRPVSPKATRASRAARVPPGLVGLLPQDRGGASPPYQHCPTPLLDPNPPFPPQATPEWRRPASNSRGSSNSPVARRPFEVAESSLNHLSSLLSSNRAVIEEPWTLPPAPRPRNLSTPSDVRSADDVDQPTSTSASQEESAVSGEDDLASSSSQHTASSHQSYPFARQHCVTSPDPPGLYDVDEFHLLRDHQIDSLLSRRADPARFDRYAFCPCEFTAFYQSAASSFVAYCNAERPLCPRDQAHRLEFFLV